MLLFDIVADLVDSFGGIIAAGDDLAEACSLRAFPVSRHRVDVIGAREHRQLYLGSREDASGFWPCSRADLRLKPGSSLGAGQGRDEGWGRIPAFGEVRDWFGRSRIGGWGICAVLSACGRLESEGAAGTASGPHAGPLDAIVGSCDVDDQGRRFKTRKQISLSPPYS